MTCAAMPVSTEQPSKSPVSLASTGDTLCGRRAVPCLLRAHGEGLPFGAFTSALLPFIDLLLELLRFLLVREAQAKETFFAFERVEEGAILVILEGIVDLLVPDDSATGSRDVNQLEPEGIPDKIVGDHHRALQASVCPSRLSGQTNIEPCGSGGEDLVRGFGDGAFDYGFVVVGQHHGHGCGWVDECAVVAGLCIWQA